MPGLEQEVKKKVNRPVSDLAITGDPEVLVNPGRGVKPKDRDKGNGNGGSHSSNPSPVRNIDPLSQSVAHFQLDAPTCPKCGHVAVRNGACFKCLNCGESLGCS
jgi:ribonucleoside-diphosphate reductase alpha chain